MGLSSMEVQLQFASGLKSPTLKLFKFIRITAFLIFKMHKLFLFL